METINFAITLSASTTNNVYPTVEILLNDKTQVKATEIVTSKTISFNLDLEEKQNYKLIIIRGNHSNRGQQILSIEKLEADGINLNKFLDNVYCYPEYPRQWHEQQIKAGKVWPDKQKGWRDLGFNGKWIIEFDTPFYTWLLKNT